MSVCVCEKAWRFPVVLPLDLKKTLLTPHKRRFVPASCVCSEKVSGGECGIRLSLFFFFCLLPFLSLPRFTNVWKPLMRNQDYSRGAQWSRSCDNPLFRCRPAVEIWAGFHWNCMSKCGSVRHLFSLTWNLLMTAGRIKVHRPISRGNLCFTPCLFLFPIVCSLFSVTFYS